ncbi:uncharacterized protein LOC113340622 [Papaver somniferum]|uniref:uncharacterized protein LOC113340622 n=1 Tax=Papaver somniferum TaxID=3469 RepID=UPI000E6F995D|nr:uncharacterized protein LOC113340622 [Papaver somniferum]
MGRKIATIPENCRPRYGNTVKARIEIDLMKPLHRGGWWKIANEGEEWISLTSAEYEETLNNEADVAESVDDERGYIHFSLYYNIFLNSVHRNQLRMKIIAWNYNGFVKKNAISYMLDINKMLSPDIVFLQETKIKSSKILQHVRTLNFPNQFFVTSIGRSRGLCLLWKDGFNLDIIYSDNNMLHCLFHSDPAKPKWVLSCVYGSPYPQRRKHQWNLLKDISSHFDVLTPWIMLVDLNITLHEDERYNNSGSSSFYSTVSQIIQDMGLSDLGYHGNPFTWTNNSHGTGKIRSRLDRALKNSDWLLHFHDSCLKHLPFLVSDHCPVLLDVFPNNVNSVRNWKFFECWLRDKTCKDQISKAWTKQFRVSPGYILDNKLSETRRDLSKWNIEVFGNIQGNLKVLQQQLSDLQQPSANGIDNTTLFEKVEKDIEEWHKREEVFYRKKSRDVFFHEV